MSWASATSPISSTTGPSSAAAARAPNAEETVPSIPFAPRLESTRGPSSRAATNSSTSRIGIDEATNSVASAGSHAASERRDERLGERLVAECPSRSRRRQRRRPRATSASHSGSVAELLVAEEWPGRGPGSASRRPRRGRATCRRDRSRSGPSSRPGEPRAQRLGGRQIAGPDHELRLMSDRELRSRAAEGRSARSRPPRVARPTAGRQAAGFGSARQSEPAPEPSRGRGRRRRRSRSARPGRPARRRARPGAVEDDVWAARGAAGAVAREARIRGRAQAARGAGS